MKIRLLKELPGIDVGTIIIEKEGKYYFEGGTEVHADFYDILSRIFNKSYPDFFEPIVEKKTYDNLEKGDRIWYIGINGKIYDSFYSNINCLSQVFLTHEEAEDEHKRREWACRKDKFIPKEKEEYYTQWRDRITYFQCTYDCIDKLIIKSGLAFRTEEECEKAIKEHDLIRLFYTIR